MKIRTDVVLKNLNGEVMKDVDAKGGATDATLKTAIVNALLSPVDKESGVDKVKKYELAKRCFNNDEVELTAEEITMIKARVGDVFGVVVVGQIFEILEGKV